MAGPFDDFTPFIKDLIDRVKQLENGKSVERLVAGDLGAQQDWTGASLGHWNSSAAHSDSIPRVKSASSALILRIPGEIPSPKAIISAIVERIQDRLTKN